MQNRETMTISNTVTEVESQPRRGGQAALGQQQSKKKTDWVQYCKNQIKGIFSSNYSQGKERSQSRQNLQTWIPEVRRLIKETGKPGKGGQTGWAHTLGIYSAEVIMGQSQKFFVSAPCFQFQTLSLNSGRYQSWTCRLQLWRNKEVSIWEANFSF